MNALTLEVILRVVYGVTDESRLAALRPGSTRTVDINPAILLGWAYPRLQQLPPVAADGREQQELDRLIYAEIRERRERPTSTRAPTSCPGSSGPGTMGPGDRLADAELRDQLVTLLLAGHETTATALSWALYEVGRSPEQLRRARKPRPARCRRHAWLDAVVKESMRLHPVIPMVVRTLMKPATIGGLDLPAGTTVGPSILITHAREPPRPVDLPTRAVPRDNPPTNTWIPFGGGVRRCIGAGFSLMEGVAVLREVFAARRHLPRPRRAEGPQHHQRPPQRGPHQGRSRSAAGPPSQVRAEAVRRARRVSVGRAASGKVPWQMQLRFRCASSLSAAGDRGRRSRRGLGHERGSPTSRPPTWAGAGRPSKRATASRHCCCARASTSSARVLDPCLRCCSATPSSRPSAARAPASSATPEASPATVRAERSAWRR